MESLRFKVWQKVYVIVGHEITPVVITKIIIEEDWIGCDVKFDPTTISEDNKHKYPPYKVEYENIDEDSIYVTKEDIIKNID